MSWLVISHLGAGVLGMTLGVILMAALAVGSASETPCAKRYAQSVGDEHEQGAGR